MTNIGMCLLSTIMALYTVYGQLIQKSELTQQLIYANFGMCIYYLTCAVFAILWASSLMNEVNIKVLFFQKLLNVLLGENNELI